MNVDEFLRGDDPTNPDKQPLFHFGKSSPYQRQSEAQVTNPTWLLEEMDAYTSTLPVGTTKLFHGLALLTDQTMQRRHFAKSLNQSTMTQC